MKHDSGLRTQRDRAERTGDSRRHLLAGVLLTCMILTGIPVGRAAADSSAERAAKAVPAAGSAQGPDCVPAAGSAQGPDSVPAAASAQGADPPAAASAQASAADRQSLDDAWWTGPLLAASAGTLPRGHFLIEPYVFDLMPQARYDVHGNRQPVPHANDFGSQSYVLYGVTDRVSAGLIPRFGFDQPAMGRGASHIGMGDLGLQAQYGLSRFQEGTWIPATALVFGETLPTGKYDRLADRPADGLGSGAYTTTLGLYSQYLWWMPNGRILRTRLDLSYAISGSASVRDLSVYGTSAGFRGHAMPGNSFIADAAGEYSVTSHWVLALDVVYEHDSSTRVNGMQLPTVTPGVGPPPIGVPAGVVLSSGPSRSVSLAPALEFNINNRVGVIAGAKLTVSGRNTTVAVIPVAAINIVL
ncbi:MAG TPA: transporter [Steroidobacteraceae bacterium]